MAHVTDLGFTLDELYDAINADEVRVQYHPEFLNLAIFNYTEETQFKNRWNKITLACRGLILDATTGEIIARPWEKFFNLGQMDNRIDSTAPVEVTDKMDGSLGILYRQPDGLLAIATRGSFASKQAIHATRRLYEYDMTYFGTDDYTFLFEIVYPDNRIVCDYGDMDELVLLGAVHKEQGYYLGPLEAQGLLAWPGPVTEVWRYDHFVEAISFPDRKGKEGVVIRSGRNIVKLKQSDYVELHRIVTNLNPKTIWEMIGNGKTIIDICSEIPDEFHGYVQKIGVELLTQAGDIHYNVLIAMSNILIEGWGSPYAIDAARADRKKFASLATVGPGWEYAKYLFLLLDHKEIDAVVWSSIRPRGDVKSLVEDNG